MEVNRGFSDRFKYQFSELMDIIRFEKTQGTQCLHYSVKFQDSYTIANICKCLKYLGYPFEYDGEGSPKLIITIQ